jgi:hypothetical protein
MKFSVYKASLDGIAAITSLSFTEVIQEIHDSTGWSSLRALRQAMTKWAQHALPGHTFKTRSSVIVAQSDVTSISTEKAAACCPECLSTDVVYVVYDEPEIDGPSDSITQIGCCKTCHRRWQDIFYLGERRVLAKQP